MIMEKTRLGRTDLQVSRTAFGALPIQRVDMAQAERILRRAFDSGINFFDTARGYTDSEEKLGQALTGVRSRLIIATKSGASNGKDLLADLETSLRRLQTDVIDVFQLHNPAALPDPEDPKGVYAAMLQAKEKGMIRFIGITNHRRDLALDAVRSGLYDTLQYPFSCLASDEELALVGECARRDIGFIAMKALSGGLLSNVPAAFAYIRQYPAAVPIWGIQRERELEEFIALEADPPRLDQSMLQAIETARQELGGAFCRACGYCLPCPAEIPIPMAARMSLLLTRMPWQNLIEPEWRGRMDRIEQCTECGQCAARCPYGLDIPALLKTELANYRQFRSDVAHCQTS